MGNSPGENSKEGYTSVSAGCNNGGRPIETHYGNFCGAQKPMNCGKQGEPKKYDGTIKFTLYPCNARAAETAEAPAEGGLELKLAPANN